MANIISRPTIADFSAKVELQQNANPLGEVADFASQLQQTEELSSKGLSIRDLDPGHEKRPREPRLFRQQRNTKLKTKSEDADAKPDPGFPAWYSITKAALATTGGSKSGESTEFASQANFDKVSFSDYEIVQQQPSDAGRPIAANSFRASLIDESPAAELFQGISPDEQAPQPGFEMSDRAFADFETDSAPSSTTLPSKQLEPSGMTIGKIPIDLLGESGEPPSDDQSSFQKRDSQVVELEFQSANALKGELAVVRDDGISPWFGVSNDATTGVARAALWQTSAVTQHLLQQTTAAITSHVGNDGTSQRISLELHPAELGQLKIHIERRKNRVTATIVASEIVAGELLNQEREQLLQTLRDLGLGDAEVEILHRRDSEQSQPESREFSREQDRGSRQHKSQDRKPSAPMIFRQGINFVA